MALGTRALIYIAVPLIVGTGGSLQSYRFSCFSQDIKEMSIPSAHQQFPARRVSPPQTCCSRTLLKRGARHYAYLVRATFLVISVSSWITIQEVK